MRAERLRIHGIAPWKPGREGVGRTVFAAREDPQHAAGRVSPRRRRLRGLLLGGLLLPSGRHGPAGPPGREPLLLTPISFWHDDVSEAGTREKLRRRVDRFRALREERRDVLLIRSCACTREAEDLAALYRVLSGRLGAPEPAGRRVLLAAVVDGQPAFEGPLRVPGWPAVAAFLQPLADEGAALEGLGYRRAIAAAVDAALDAPEGRDAAAGFGLGEGVGALEPSRLHPCDAGMRSGYEGLACFEDDPEALHVDLGASDASLPAPSG
ncbi:unnamed protein product [Prorocentrum cordatum]|uniref:Uncharacterized protein n=1 Tax=Prorocentrum cordatum TaxID=2364126 RepID=A0ABN9S2E9_9DINO|nr:unnamed protein product [Polarella glacialis]